jgi:hypothetical protein
MYLKTPISEIDGIIEAGIRAGDPPLSIYKTAKDREKNLLKKTGEAFCPWFLMQVLKKRGLGI